MGPPIYYYQHQTFLITHEDEYATTSHQKKLFVLCSLNWKYYNRLKNNKRCVNGLGLVLLILYSTFNLYAIGNQYDECSGCGMEPS